MQVIRRYWKYQKPVLLYFVSPELSSHACKTVIMHDTYILFLMHAKAIGNPMSPVLLRP